MPMCDHCGGEFHTTSTCGYTQTKLYVAHSVTYKVAPALQAMLPILEWIGWQKPEVVVGIEPIARITQGRFNPARDFVLVMPDGVLVRNPVELCRWIESKGLVPM